MNLHSFDFIKYLASIILISKSNNNQNKFKETEAITSIQNRIGAKKSDLTKAHNIAGSSNFKIEPFDRFALNVQLLEDMIFISMIDGEIDNFEKSNLYTFASTIGITSEQLKVMALDIKKLLTSLTDNFICPKCNFSFSGQAKFCPQCGYTSTSINTTPAPINEYKIPNEGISIEFMESTAIGFSDALNFIKTAPINSNCIKLKKNWYMASWPIINFIEISKLANHLKGMRNRKVYIDGIEHKWDEVFGFCWCLEQRNSAFKPNEYCFGLSDKRLNIFGCKQSNLEWNEWADWFTYGTFKKVGLLGNQVNFEFDKSRINHELQTNLFRFRFCPYINFKLIEAVLEAIPNEITVAEKGLWEYKHDYHESPGSIKVKIKENRDGFTYTDEFYSSGVSPKSITIGLEILKKAIFKIDPNNDDFKQILLYKGTTVQDKLKVSNRLQF